MKTSSVLRVSDIHINTDAYHTAASEYYMCYVIDNSGEFTPCLLTKDDINKGIERTQKNKEDVLPLSWPLWAYHKIKTFLQ